MSMKATVLAFDTPEGREAAIAEMLADLTASRDSLEHGSIDERGVSLLMELMPAFVRGLDRERLLFIEECKAGNGAGIDAIDDHLMVIALPIVNMIGSVITTLLPGQRQSAHGRARPDQDAQPPASATSRQGSKAT